jgi:anti-sigma factor RsiW
MTCVHMTALLHGRLDGELDLVNAMAFEEHVRHCPGCAEAYREQHALRTVLRRQPKYRAPDHLRQRIQAALGTSAPAAKLEPVSWWRRAVANGRWATGFAIALAASIFLFIAAPGNDRQDFQSELIASHVRSRLADHLTDVATSDQHTVKPWFSSKLDYSPPVTDLASDGFPLVGGRLDYLHDRVVAALVYKRHEHVINLFVWPATDTVDSSAQISSREGFHICHWTRSGMGFWAVSDTNPADLEEFERLFRARAPS